MGLWDWVRGFRARGARLEPLMAALAAGGGADARRRFFAAFMRARLLLPSPGLAAAIPPANARTPSTDPVTINLIGADAPDGTKGLVAFTSEPALRAWRPVGCPYVEIVGANVVQMVLTEFKSIFINPRGPTAGTITHAELLALAEGTDAAAPSPKRNGV